MERMMAATEMRELAETNIKTRRESHIGTAVEMMKIVYGRVLHTVSKNPDKMFITFNPSDNDIELHRMTGPVFDIVCDMFRDLKYQVDVKSTRTAFPGQNSPVNATVTIKWEK